MFDAQAHATSDALVAMLSSELDQERQAKGNAMVFYCDRSIAELNQLIIDYPESKHTWVRLIERWQEIKQKHGQRSAQDLLNAEYARLASTPS
ncbi:conserved hypothetical protein [Shewanella sp. W3-18-1]|uniref:hypothetical protein n=1 Tax=Shewanella sp. (strain W3-18-1) TaxID=351745 RepID=UPI0000ECFB27|nr:hypothetical protein [Shewanella sp. W3-18-1]ABM25337.1 conserved hypothetical protein [Shewanella sp. W3-18-1]